jgi:hypothetical protein
MNEPVVDAIIAHALSGRNGLHIKKATVKPAIIAKDEHKNANIILGPSLMIFLISHVSMNMISIRGRKVEYIKFCALLTPSADESKTPKVAQKAIKRNIQIIAGKALITFVFSYFLHIINTMAIDAKINA